MHIRRELQVQSVHHVGHDEPTPQRMLEYAAAISILAFRRAEDADFACCRLHRLHLVNEARHFDSVCPDVLDGRCPHLTRDERQVFETVKTVPHAVLHKAVPISAGSDPEPHV